jgi:hypothetical protein
MMKKTLATIAIAGFGIAACGSSSSSTTPPSAKTVLQQDGYTYDPALTNAAQSGASMPAGTASVAAGAKGDSIQIVIVFSDSALADVGYAGAKRDLSGKGLAVAHNGDVVTATGPSSAFSSLG